MINYKQIANLDKLKRGDHTVLLYKKEVEILAASVSFIKTSLARNEKCIYIKGDLEIEVLLSELRKQLSALDLYIQSGQLQILSKEDTYALSDNFKADEMIDFLKKESLNALQQGYKGLAITGELSWALNFENGKKEIIDYEWKLNEYIFNNYPLIAMCRYNLNKFDDEIIKSIIELHHYVIWQGKIHENPYYIPPEGYRDNQILKYKIENWLTNIQEYEKRESKFKEELQVSQNRYQRLLNSAPIGIVTTSSDGRAFSINKAMADILGFSSVKKALKEYTDLSRDLYVNSERREELLKILEEKGEVKSFDYKARKIDGSEIYLSMNAKKRNVNKNFFVIEAFVFDITKRKKAEIKLENKKNELTAFNEQLTAYSEEILAMNEELEQSLEEINELNIRFVKMIDLFSNDKYLKQVDEEEFLNDIFKTAIKVIPEANYGSVYTYQDGKVKFINTIGYPKEKLQKINIPAEAFYNKKSNLEVIKIEEVEKRNKEYMDKDEFKKLKDSSYIMKEIMYMDLEIAEQKKAGLSLDIDHESEQVFSGNSRKIFRAFHNIASSYYNLKDYSSLQKSFTKELITSIVKLLEMHDLYTKGHSENVADLASKLAEKIGLPQKMIDDVYWAGLVHDIGKLLVPLDILNKAEKLTEEEFELIKGHPVIGSRALEGSESLKHIAKYVKFHHERWDGTGYPYGLSKNEIPILSQIIQVVDSWDAMRSDRAYRKGISFDEAVREIKSNIGSQFPPKITEAFLEMTEDKDIITIS